MVCHLQDLAFVASICLINRVLFPECDKEYNQLLSSFLAILLQLTTMTYGLPDAQWAHRRTKWLWDSFQQQGLQKIFEKSLLHENTLLQLANRPRVVPRMLVKKEKYNVLDAFYVSFFSTLQDETPKPLAVLRFFVVSLPVSRSSMKPSLNPTRGST